MLPGVTKATASRRFGGRESEMRDAFTLELQLKTAERQWPQPSKIRWVHGGGGGRDADEEAFPGCRAHPGPLCGTTVCVKGPRGGR